MSRAAKAAAIAWSVAFTGIAVASAAAETQWEKNHPRRTEVNDRLKNQDRRINKELREGRNHQRAGPRASQPGSCDPPGRADDVEVQQRPHHARRAEIAQPAGKRCQPGDRQVVQVAQSRPKKRGRACGRRTRPLKRVVCQPNKTSPPDTCRTTADLQGAKVELAKLIRCRMRLTGTTTLKC